MPFDPDHYSCAGKIRLRAKALDPFAGLRGRAYLQARSLDTAPPKHLEAEAQIKSESRENLIKAINGGKFLGLSNEQHFTLGLSVVKTKPKASSRRRFTVITNPVASQRKEKA